MFGRASPCGLAVSGAVIGAGVDRSRADSARRAGRLGRFLQLDSALRARCSIPLNSAARRLGDGTRSAWGLHCWERKNDREGVDSGALPALLITIR